MLHGRACVRACRAAVGKVRCVHTLGKCVQNGDRCVPDRSACVQGTCMCVNRVYHDMYVCTFSTYIEANIYSKFFFAGGDMVIDLGQVFLYLGCVILWSNHYSCALYDIDGKICMCMSYV